jgi:hypothetical protein
MARRAVKLTGLLAPPATRYWHRLIEFSQTSNDRARMDVKKLGTVYLSEPVLAVSLKRRGIDTYRLKEGRVEFKASGQEQWRNLDYDDIQQHFSLETVVGRWLGHSNTLAETARSLLQD